MRVLKLLFGLVAALFVVLLLVGLVLPRQWKVEVSTPTTATAAPVSP